MNRLTASTMAISLICASFAGIADSAGASEPTPQALLTDALLCKGDPLATVRRMAASGSSSFDRGFAAATFGEEMDEMDVVILRSPLEIAGSKTSAVLLTFAQSEDFGALVYGRFRGDYHQAVSALKLAPTAKKDGLRLGQFTKALTVDADGHPDKVCPMTIALTPLEDGAFSRVLPQEETPGTSSAAPRPREFLPRYSTTTRLFASPTHGPR